MWIDYPNQIQKARKPCFGKEKRLKATPMADRVRFLRLLKSATYPTQTQVADLLGYDVRTLRRWWRCYRTEGLPGLLGAGQKTRGQRADHGLGTRGVARGDETGRDRHHGRGPATASDAVWCGLSQCE